MKEEGEDLICVLPAGILELTFSTRKLRNLLLLAQILSESLTTTKQWLDIGRSLPPVDVEGQTSR